MMRSIHFLLIALSILILTSCFVSNSSNNDDIKRPDVLGSWKITKESSQKINNKTADNEKISYFQLNADSTVIVSFGDSMEKKMTGTWVWKAEKKLGNNNLGLSLKTDVVIYVNSSINNLFFLGLQLNKTDGKINLTTADYSFEKQDTN